MSALARLPFRPIHSRHAPRPPSRETPTLTRDFSARLAERRDRRGPRCSLVFWNTTTRASTLAMRHRRSSAPEAEIGSERPVLSAEDLPLGSHVITPRLGYNHHGIYVGDGKVVQYGGLVRGLRTGPVEEVPLIRFTRGFPLWERPEPALHFDRDEIVRRARSRVGEDRYQLLSNNCEHFCEWCLRATPRSYQVEGWWLTRMGLVLKSFSGSVAALFVVARTRRA